MSVIVLDPNDEDGVCGAAYQEWRGEQLDFDSPEDEWYDDEQDNEWECE